MTEKVKPLYNEEALGFREHLDGLLHIYEGDSSMLRIHACECLKKFGFPAKKRDMEFFDRELLRKLYGTRYTVPVKNQLVSPADISNHVFSECSQSVLVFVDGVYSRDFSSRASLPKQVALLPLNDAIKRYSAFFGSTIIASLNNETNPFVLLNGAFCSSGVFLYIPPEIVVEAPLQILNIVTRRDVILSPRFHLFAGKNSSIDICHHTVHTGGDVFFNAVSDMVVDSGAVVRYTTTSSGSSLWHFDATRVRVKQRGAFESVVVTDGGEGTVYDSRIILEEEGASASLAGVAMMKGREKTTMNVAIDHKALSTISKQRFKSVLGEKSRASFTGKILIRSDAQYSDARQSQSTLLLDDTSLIKIAPVLEVFADDVQASHGATVGALDDEQLFYLRSRGLSMAEAKRFLLSGFVQEILDFIPVCSVRENQEQYAQAYVS